MTGQRGDSRFGRGRVGPLQAVTPTRLPGGVWGPPPVSGLVSFDAQGTPSSGYGAIDATSVSSSLVRAEWPLPVRWEVQVFLDLQRIAYVGNPPAPPPDWSAPIGAFGVRGLLQWRIESASAQLPIDLVLGPGLYPLTAAIQGVPGLGATFAFMAQQVEARFLTVDGIGDPSLANSTWRYSASFLVGLTSAGWPAP
jgi:hypothetical protein